MEDLYNVQWRATFSGLDIEKIEEHTPPTQSRLNVLLPIGHVDIRIEIIRGDQIEEGLRVHQKLPAASGWQQHILFPAKKLQMTGHVAHDPKWRHVAFIEYFV